MSFWRYIIRGPWLPILLAVSIGALTRRDTREWLRARPTDWNAVRESLGYCAAPDRPLRKLPAAPQRKLLGFWPLATDWDRVRREYGDGRTVEGDCRVLPDRPESSP